MRTLLVLCLSSIILAELSDDTSLLQADQPSWGSNWRDQWKDAAQSAMGGMSGGTDFPTGSESVTVSSGDAGHSEGSNWKDKMAVFGNGVQKVAVGADNAIRDISSNMTELIGIVKTALNRFSSQNDARKEQIIAEIDAAKTRKKKLAVYESRLLEFMNVTGAVWDSYAYANQEMLKYMQRLSTKVQIPGEFIQVTSDAIGHIVAYRDQVYRSKEKLAGISKQTDRAATLRMMSITRSLKDASVSMNGLSKKIVSYAKRQEGVAVSGLRTMLGSLLPSNRIDSIQSKITKVVDVTGTIGDSLTACGQKLADDVNGVTKHIRIALKLKRPTRAQKAPATALRKKKATVLRKNKSTKRAKTSHKATKKH